MLHTLHVTQNEAVNQPRQLDIKQVQGIVIGEDHDGSSYPKNLS